MWNLQGLGLAGLRPALLAMGLAAIPVAPAGAVERFPLAGDHVAIYNLAGHVQVISGTGRQVEVEVRRQGHDGDRLRVETGLVAGRQTLRVIYPSGRIVYREAGGHSSTSLRVREDGAWGGDLGGGRRVTVASWGFGLEAGADLSIHVPRGKKVGVHLALGEVSIANVDGDIAIDVQAAPVRAQHTRGRLALDSGSGSVEVWDAQGDVSIDTGSGGADLEGIQGGSLTVDTGSGGVRGGRIAVGRLSVDTGSGGVELGEVSAPEIRLDTGSGHVRLDLRQDVELLDVDTGSGGVTILVPEKLGAELEVEVGSGGIDIDVPHELIGRVGRDHYRCKIGDGQGRIHIETGSGGVRLRRG